MTTFVMCYLIGGMLLTAYELAFMDCRSVFGGKSVGTVILILIVALIGWPYVLYHMWRAC